MGVGGVTRVWFQFAAELKLQHSNIPVCTNTKIWKLNHLVHGYMYYKWCLKNPSTCKYECNQTQGGGRIGDRPVYRKWSVYTHINIKIQWNKVWSTAVPNNSRHDDGTLHVEAGLMMVFPSKSYFGYKKTNHLIEVLVFVQIVYARKFASAWFQSNLNLMQILVDATKVQFDKNN